MAGEAIKERIELSLDSTGIPKNSLAGLITQLEQVEAKWKSLDSIIAGTNTALAQTPRKVGEIQAQLIKAQAALVAGSGKGAGFKASAIATALGADAAAFEKHLAGVQKGVDGYRRTMQTFRTLPTAARAFAGFEAQNYKALQKQVLSLRDLMRPGISSVHGTGQIKVDGVIPLAIPASQVQALYRRLPFGRSSAKPKSFGMGGPCGLETRDTADWPPSRRSGAMARREGGKSALRHAQD